jgi:tetratricopeptide (TPR) repeat protein
MRLAVVASSRYEHNAKLSEELCAAPSVGVIQEALGNEWEVESYELDRPFPDLLEQTLYSASRRPTELLIYACGLVALADGRPPALVLDGERLGTLSLGRLGRLLDRMECRCSLVIDGKLLSLNGGSADEALEQLDVELGTTTAAALVSLREDSEESDAPTAVAQALAEVIQASPGTAPDPGSVVSRLNGQDGLRLLHLPGGGSVRPSRAAGAHESLSGQSLPPPPVVPNLRPPSLPPLNVPGRHAASSPLPPLAALPHHGALPALNLPPPRLPALAAPAARAAAAPAAVPPYPPSESGEVERMPLASPSPLPPLRAPVPNLSSAPRPDSERPDSERPESERADSDAASESEPPPTLPRISADASGARRMPAGATPLPLPSPLPERPASDLPPPRRSPSGSWPAPGAAETLGKGSLPPPSLPPPGSVPPPAAVASGPAPSIPPPPGDSGFAELVKRGRELEATDDHEDASEQYKRALLVARSDKHKAVLHVALGRCARAMGRPAVALGNFQKALGLDFEQGEALRAAAELLEERKDWAGLASLDELVASSHPNAEQRSLAIERLTVLFEDHLHDPQQAAKTWARIVVTRPSDVTARERLARSQAEIGAVLPAIDQNRAIVALEPRRVSAYRGMLELSRRANLEEQAFNAASVLDYLGVADINESLLVTTHRPEGLLPIQGKLTNEDWRQGGLLAERTEVGRLLELVSEQAKRAELTWLKKRKRLPKLDPEARHDTKASTTTLAKSLLWTSRVLAIGEPALYLDSAGSGLESVPSAEHSVIASRSVGSGVSLPELVFVWGRALAVLHPEHSSYVYFSVPKQLSELVLAAALATGRDVPAPSTHVKHLANAFKRRLDADVLRQVGELVNAASDTALQRRWVHSVELCCVRAGLVVSGHLQAAADLTKRFPFGVETDAETQISELLRYGVSLPYAKLRERLGVKIDA